jgi:beta-glucosidase
LVELAPPLGEQPRVEVVIGVGARPRIVIGVFVERVAHVAIAAPERLIQQKIDFLGLNYYTRGVTKADPKAWPVAGRNEPPKGATLTETGWEIYPKGLTDAGVDEGALRRFASLRHREWRGYEKSAPKGGRIHDQDRVDYLRTHLAAVHDAIKAGVDVRGYMVWSLLDNLEWSLGYSKTFGIVHVNFETQKRTPKDSARFYAEMIASNGAGALD